MAVAGALVLAVLGWVFMFVPNRRGVWRRTWVCAAVLSAYSLAVLAATGTFGEVAGPFTLAEVGIGLAVGAAWIVATQVGHRVLAALIPSFAARLDDLYGMRSGTRHSEIAGPIVAMGIAEELLFRGTIQARTGLVLAVVAYAAVQLVERNWALIVAAVLSGLVWGLLFEWRDGLVAPVVAHVAWTLVLAVVWPLGDEGTQPAGADPPLVIVRRDAARSHHARRGTQEER